MVLSWLLALFLRPKRKGPSEEERELASRAFSEMPASASFDFAAKAEEALKRAEELLGERDERDT